MDGMIKDLNIALKDLKFNYRMWKRRESEFININLLNYDIEVFNKIIKRNNDAFRKADIIVINDNLEIKTVKLNDYDYIFSFSIQYKKYKKLIETCKDIIQYKKDMDKEVDLSMSEVYDKVSLSYKKDEKSQSEDKEDMTKDADYIISSLTEKSDLLKEKMNHERPKLTNIAIRRVNRLYDTIDEISHYYNKFEQISDDKKLGFYEENLEYIEEDLTLDIDYLNKKSLEYKKLYEEKKPLPVRVNENCKYYIASDAEYDMAFNSISLSIDIALEKGKIIKTKNFNKDKENAPKNDIVSEMIFNELYEVSKEIENAINSGNVDYNTSMQKLWTDSSIQILNILKTKLDDDYKNGRKIKLARFENGKYIVTEVNNSLENYQLQSIFLNNNIKKCMELKEKLADVSKFKEESKQKKESNFVVVQKNNEVIVIGNILEEDLKHASSEILDNARKNNIKISIVNNLNPNSLNQISGLLVEINEKGTISIGGEYEKAEFHNQEELVKTYKKSKTTIKNPAEKLLIYKENNNIDGMIELFHNVEPSIIWKDLARKINKGIISYDETLDTIDFVINNYGTNELREDNITNNNEYRSLLRMLKMTQNRSVSNDDTLPLSTDARKIKERKENKGLIEKFKNLKKWQKVMIVAGLSLAGAAVVGVGVYHLIPEVRPMIDSFIQGLNPSRLTEAINGKPEITINESVNQLNPTSSAPLDFSSIGKGHTIFSDAYSAVSGNNPIDASSFFNNNPIDVFNIDTNQYMGLTSEQLHDADFLRNLANNPNYAMLFGADINNPDGFVPLSDIVSEAIQGGKVL